MHNYDRFSKARELFLALIVALGLLSLIGTSSALAQDVGPQAEGLPTDQIILKYKSGSATASTQADTVSAVAPSPTDDMERLSAAAGIHLEYARAMSGDAHVLRLPEKLSLEQVQAISQQLMTLPEVEYAEPDQIMQPTLTPNDPLYGNQWHYSGTYGIKAPAAWDITTGSSSIVAAVADTGITNHADLSGRTVPGYDFIADTFVANDGDGRDSDPSDPGDWTSANECYPGSPARNSSWHGTHVAGTIGAASNNNLGVAGINWNSKILPVRVLGKCGGYISDIADGMRWAAGLAVSGVPANSYPAKVINLSLGGSGSCGTTYQSAIDAITAAGAVVVVSAGNSTADASGFRPANCNNVITVAATNRVGSRAYYSNFGSVVEISAPGGAQSFANDPNGVLSTLNTGTTVPVADTYIYYQGTSMAAPHVTGVVSLLFSRNPNLTPTQVLQTLQTTAQLFPGGSTCDTSICGAGIVNAAAAVNSIGLQTFTDVPTSHWAYSWIESLYAAGVTGGCATNPLRYCPNDQVKRSEMAKFLLKGEHGGAYAPPAGTGTRFTDVPLSYWAVNWIEQLAAEGITTGCNPPVNTQYCPDSFVKRSEMAVFLLRGEHGGAYAPPAGTGTRFTDVPLAYWAVNWIEQLAAEDITTGCNPPTNTLYCPDSNVTRAEMAVFLVRTFDLP